MKTHTKPFRRAFNAIGVLSDRLAHFGQPGLQLWTDAAKRALVEIRLRVGRANRRNDAEVARIQADLAAMVADGQIDPVEFARLAKYVATLTRMRARCGIIERVVAK